MLMHLVGCPPPPAVNTWCESLAGGSDGKTDGSERASPGQVTAAEEDSQGGVSACEVGIAPGDRMWPNSVVNEGVTLGVDEPAARVMIGLLLISTFGDMII